MNTFGQITLSMITNGDLVRYVYNNTRHVGEVVDIDDNDTVTIHALIRQAEYNGKLWRFNNVEHEISVTKIDTLVKPERPLCRKTMKSAWSKMGYEVGVDLFCLKEDEKDVVLDVHPQDSDDEMEENENDPNYIHPEMRDFIVPDDECEPFTFADANKLSGDAKKFVQETHKAVNDWNDWTPDPNQPMQKKIKDFVDNMAGKINHQESDKQFSRGSSSLITSKPPLS